MNISQFSNMLENMNQLAESDLARRDRELLLKKKKIKQLKEEKTRMEGFQDCLLQLKEEFSKLINSEAQKINESEVEISVLRSTLEDKSLEIEKLKQSIKEMEKALQDSESA